jgi:hypothetical protein
MQDQVSSLLTEVNRDFGRIRQAVRNQKAVLALTAEANAQRDAREVLSSFENEEDDLRYLLEAVKAKSSNLRMTSSDIRLLYGIVEQQIKLGEIQPGRSQFRSAPPQESEPARSPQEPSLSEIQESVDLPEPAQVQQPEPEPVEPSLVLVEDGSSTEALEMEAFLDS